MAISEIRTTSMQATTTGKDQGIVMPDHVYKTIEITGSSTTSIEAAVETALGRADESLHSLRWFEVDNIRGHLEDGKISHWQVTVKIGFAMD
jgi:flavin-binding protein dodecin